MLHATAEGSILAIAVIGTLLVASCSDPTPPRSGQHAPVARASDVSPGAPKGHAERWAGFARAVPGFGGMYYDENGDLVVVLKDTLSQRNTAAIALASYVGRSGRPAKLGPVGHAAMILFVTGRYDYLELLTFRDQVSTILQPVNSELSSVALDEITNSIRVGVMSSANLALVGSLLQRANIPLPAFTLVREDRPTLLSSTMFLRDTITPVVGGHQLWTAGTKCSAGLPVRFGNDSLPGLLFSGHCAGANGDSIGLIDRNDNVYYIGAVVDNGHWTYGCTHGTCMHADAALAQLKASVTSYHGGIANGDTGPAFEPSAYWSGTYGDPTAFNSWLNYGTGDGPLMVAADFTPGGEVVGQWVGKIGMQTGWTEGKITQALFDEPTNNGYWLTPAVEVQAATYQGDSGSPVFSANGDIGSIDGNPPVTFNGLLVSGSDFTMIGGNAVYKKFYYSPQYDVRFEQLYTHYIYTHR